MSDQPVFILSESDYALVLGGKPKLFMDKGHSTYELVCSQTGILFWEWFFFLYSYEKSAL